MGLSQEKTTELPRDKGHTSFLFQEAIITQVKCLPEKLIRN
jgi:hypothetical protein